MRFGSQGDPLKNISIILKTKHIEHMYKSQYGFGVVSYGNEIQKCKICFYFLFL